MRRFGGTAGGVSSRFRGFEDRIRKSGTFCTWLCCVLLIGLGVSTSAIAQTAVIYIHTDALGSVVAESDANGNVSDSVTGLSYMQRRYMDPQLGVFLSVDPVTAYEQPVGQFNRYRYASSNPYRFVDPDGRYDCEATKAQCQQIDRAMSKVYAAQGKATGDAKTVLDGVAGFSGKKGDGNGVPIRNADTNSGSWLGLQKGGILRVNFQALNNSASQLGRVGQDFMVASAVVHEGWHGWWGKLAYAAGIGDPWSRSYSTNNERRAGAAEALLARGLNYSHPQGFWTRGGGFDRDKIKAQAAKSVDIMCAASTQGGLPCAD
ncbi:RHS repeat-associated core domain-containing protein [Stenotrophomonas maltophilia]|uniref:RHS repeat-associated core domain-containing protein n=1 Tax=Stenotrophomonas maltophilia TaxID=40324 RepID=UPI001EDB00B2|nr:RHS repeat-associated core domain-containing protein [Stenotrophomonas maltophilia]